jgi:adenylate cyclase
MGERSTGYWVLCAVLILLISAPLAYAAHNARTFGPETKANDIWFRTRLPRAPRADMLIVARDEKTIQEMDAPTHTDYGTLIRKLKDAGAKWIVLDLDLDDRQGRAADRALYTAIADSHRTLVMVRYKQDRVSEPDADELRGLRALERSAHWQEFAVKPGTPEWGWLNFAPATSDFIHSAHGAGVAVTEQSLDPDAVMRRSRTGYLTKVLYPYDTKQGKLTNFYAVVPNLAVITAVSAMGGDKTALQYRFGQQLSFDGKAPQPFSPKGLTPVDYIGPAGTYPRVSMVDVLQDRQDDAVFKDRIVFVGSTVPTDNLTENRMTPLGSRMPRVEITANQVQSFLNARPLTESWVAGAWGIIGFGLLLALLVPAFRPVGAILAGIGGLLLYFLVGWLLFMFSSIMLPVLPALILAAGAIGIALILQAVMRPYARVMDVEVRDTGMAVGAGEDLPTPRRRWGFPGRRGRV